MTLRLRLALSAALVGVLALTAVATAAPKKQPSPYATQIKELHAVKRLLELADHDYKGHRAAAVKQIGAAIHVLQAGYAHPPRTGKPGKGGNEPQALSDAQLQEAINSLTTIKTQLSSVQTVAAATAVTELGKAITELNTALKIK